MKRFKMLFVVHRYVPFPGGSEYYVRDMAEEMLSRGHSVTVLATDHKGDQNGVHVTSDYNVLNDRSYDMIIVHGCDCSAQNVVLANSHNIQVPILYMIIKPSFSPVSMTGMRFSKYLAYSTPEDLEHIKTRGLLDKARRVRHGINLKTTMHDPNKYNLNRIRGTHFMSAGGYYPHKAMIPLADAFEKANIPDRTLHLYGYADGPKPNESSKVKVYLGTSREDVMLDLELSRGYIMNSYEEGFGLVLLEALVNGTPTFARNIAGAKVLQPYVYLYNSEDELMDMLKNFQMDFDLQEKAAKYVIANHSIVNTCNDIEDVIMEDNS